MATITAARADHILDALDAYEGENIWQDVIRALAEFDEAWTEEIDPGDRSDRFVAGGREFRHCQGRGWWLMTLPPGESGR